MSLPQTQETIDQLRLASGNAATLLAQYFRLTQTLESQGAGVQALSAELNAARATIRQRDERILELEGQLRQRDATIAQMREHPDVKTARLAEARRRLEAARAEVESLTPMPAPTPSR